MTTNFQQQVADFCHTHSLLQPNETIVVGVSGGADSLSLLHCLRELAATLKLTLLVAHLNHQLRGADSQADEIFVRSLATQWQLPIFIESHDVGALAKQRQQSLEETARQARYAFLWRVAHQQGASKIAVGHHADDHVETILMHFLRGSGLAGLRGLLPSNPISTLQIEPPTQGEPLASVSLIRPLLEMSRTSIETYCYANQLVPRQDESNQDVTFFRNRLRHELLPLLESYNPNIRQTLQRTAKVAQSDVDFLNAQLETLWPTLTRRVSPDLIEVELAAWRALPVTMQRATLRDAIQQIRHTLRDIGFDHIEATLKILNKGNTGAKATLPAALQITLGYDSFVLATENTPAFASEATSPSLVSSDPIPLTIPGVTPLPGTAWQLTAQLLTPPIRLSDESTKPWELLLDADQHGTNLALRSRQPGDRFAPLGLDGRHQKVKTFMINEKIPADQRASIPMLVSGDQILWVCGYRPAEGTGISAATERVLQLKFESTS
ncbi:MAG: tRNA lysidine(34) synthetase TilS [Chloroflexota bacterium]